MTTLDYINREIRLLEDMYDDCLEVTLDNDMNYEYNFKDESSETKAGKLRFAIIELESVANFIKKHENEVV